MNGVEHAPWYAELVREVEPGVRVEDAPDRLATMLTQWLKEANLATSLEELSVPQEGIEQFTEDALKQWTGTFNPISLDAKRVKDLYQSVA
jgi:alcohol dehydrogenase